MVHFHIKNWGTLLFEWFCWVCVQVNSWIFIALILIISKIDAISSCCDWSPVFLNDCCSALRLKINIRCLRPSLNILFLSFKFATHRTVLSEMLLGSHHHEIYFVTLSCGFAVCWLFYAAVVVITPHSPISINFILLLCLITWLNNIWLQMPFFSVWTFFIAEVSVFYCELGHQGVVV